MYLKRVLLFLVWIITIMNITILQIEAEQIEPSSVSPQQIKTNIIDYDKENKRAEISYNDVDDSIVIFADYHNGKLVNIDSVPYVAKCISHDYVEQSNKSFTLDKDDKIYIWSSLDNPIPKCVEYICESNSDEYKKYKSVVPENEGVKNTIRNFKQMLEITYTPKKTINVIYEDLKANKTYKALPYSSSRIENLFVPNNVSFHTFMTAVQNPNSYLYTMDLEALGNENGYTYYGAVCSTACGYALGLEPIYASYQWKDIPGMKIIDITDAYDLKLGDTMWEPGHVSMVTDITKNKHGKIGHITISEWWWPKGRSVNYTFEKFMKKYNKITSNQHPLICRYSKINTVKYVPSPYVAVGGEEQQEIIYNTDIIPRKGDKANWLYGADIEIDILNKNLYTSVEIYKNDVLYKTLNISNLIILKNLDYGDYKARLTNNNGKFSDWCYWKVIDAKSSAIPVGNDGKINVTFSVSNATPLYVQWCNNKNGTKYINLLSDEEIKNGEATCSYIPGKYKIRVAFKTDYGIIFSELPDAITVN